MTAVAVGLSLFAAAPALAAETPAEVGAVVVTASRVQTAGFTAPTPVTVIGLDTLQEKGVNNMREAIVDLPAVLPQSPAALFDTNVGGQYVNLRGLTAGRTLILVDGRRYVPTNNNGSVDLNVIPSSLVERLEIVTGGASAAWGSDAVSGVVNMILKREVNGISGEIQYGVTQLGDGKDYSGNLLMGHSFGGGKGQVTLAFEGQDLHGILDRVGNGGREWERPNYALVANPTFTATNGQMRLILSDNAHLSTMTRGGLINNTILRGTAFGPGGQPTQFQYGTNVGTLWMSGGVGEFIGHKNNLLSPIQRYSIYGRGHYDFTENLSMFLESSLSYVYSYVDIIEKYDQNNITIRQDNAFLPASIRATMVANNIQTFTMGRIHTELGEDFSHVRNLTRRYVGGFQGTIGGNWRWMAYYQYGKNHYRQAMPDQRIQANWLLAVDSVINPATGRAVCRSTLTNPNNGCIPANVFGPNSISAEAVDYLRGDSFFTSAFSQNVAAADISGDLFDLWAGPVAMAAGVEWRKEELVGQSDPTSEAQGFRFGNPRGLRGEVSVKEGFLEAAVPLAKDTAFAQSLDLNGAIRVTDYSNSGSVTTWKIGGTWEPNDSIRFRATRSRDIRAPKLSELFQPGDASVIGVDDKFTNTQPRIIGITTGSNNLIPERADTFTGGVVLMPSFVPGLRMSADFYDIDIKDAIGSLGAQGVIDRCFTGATQLCGQITRVNGVITQVSSGQLNFSSLQARGVDFEASYVLDAERILSSFRGRITFRLLGNYVDRLATNDGLTTVDLHGQHGQTWRGTFGTSYRNGPLIAAMNLRYIGGGTWLNTFTPTDIDPAVNHIKDQVYMNLSLQYTILDEGRRRLQLFATVDNALDHDPPLYTTGQQQPHATDPAFYDTLGRRFGVGLRFGF